jgi:ligand-binding SRPBCC domain-containing protein
MRLFELRAQQRLPLSMEEAWSFFSDPTNLQEITLPSMGFQVTSELPPRMHPGLIITYKVRLLLGVPVNWVTEITHVVEPVLFVDEQRFGPYRFWHHQHHFREVEGGVEMTDIVHYTPPSPAAPLLDRLLIGPKLKQIFDFRGDVLRRRFGTLP